MFHLPAALSFYRALRVYPSPVELIMIYQKTVPEPVFKVSVPLLSVLTVTHVVSDCYAIDGPGREYSFVTPGGW